MANLSFAHGGPFLSGCLRRNPHDFVVNEVLGFGPSGQGEHWLLRVEKQQANTAWVAQRLAAFAKVRERDVGYCGLKDRNAVTTQWFSVLSKKGVELDWANFHETGVVILETARHHRKLRRGSHHSNQFVIRISDVDTQGCRQQRLRLVDRLIRVHRQGVPNYFAEQRFGREYQNVSRAFTWLIGRGPSPRRNQRTHYLSATRALMFNTVLAERVNDATWNCIVDGDLANLDGSRSVFSVDTVADELVKRCSAMDIHPTGPMPGRGNSDVHAQAELMENTALAPLADAVSALAAHGVDAARRALRVRVNNLTWRIGDDTQCDDKQTDIVTLSFELTPGAFATAVLRELFITTPS